MRIGITGVSGLIGRRVAKLARERGHEVIEFSRKPRAGQRLFRLGAPPDLTGCEAVINLAGENVAGLWTPAKRRAIRESRVLGTRGVVASIRAMKRPPRVLLNASGIAIYGDTGETTATEEHPHGGSYLAEVCEAWEAEALQARTAGVRVALLRTSMVLSRAGGALGAMLPVFRLGLGGRLGSGRQWLPWIHIEDQAALAVALIEDETLHGAFNASGPNPVRNRDFTRMLAAAVHRPALFWVPGLALRAVLGGFADEVLQSRRIIPAAAAAAGFAFRFPSLPEALADLLS